jgi:hypothetical protein
MADPVIRGDSLYTVVDGPSWTQAEASSVKLGGHLVTINNWSEYKWLSDNVTGVQEHIKNIPTNRPLDVYFVGLNDAQIEGAYTWASGEKTSGADWTNIKDIFSSQQRVGEALNSHDYFVIHSNSDGQNHPILAGTNPWDTANGQATGLINVDDSSSFYKAWGLPHYGLAETPFIRRGDSAYVVVQGPTWTEAEANAVKLGGT